MNDSFDYLKFKYSKEHLHNVFATNLDTFLNIGNANVTGSINLWELFQSIKYNLTSINTNILLTPKYIDDKKNAAYDGIKSSLPAVCYNSTFNGYKNLNNVSCITNLMFLDIDFKTREEASQYRNYVTLKYDWIVSCSFSLSRTGLHIVILVDKIHNNDDFNNKYDFINEVYFDGKLDKLGKSLIRYAVIPFDYSIYINETPNVLNIEHIMNKIKKGTSSGYKERKIIPTSCTFSSPSPLKEILNDSGRKDGLIFKQAPDESLFITVDTPLFYPKGIDVIEVNIFPYRDRKIKDGQRTFTIGGIICRLIYLNAFMAKRTDDEIKTVILKLITNLNSELCDPPLTYKEVVNSFNNNWQKYLEDNLNFNLFFENKKVFWSRECTLSPNEKRKITCKLLKQPIVDATRKKIDDAIKTIPSNGERITQKKVAEVSKVKLRTVKNYWKIYKGKVKLNNSTINDKGMNSQDTEVKEPLSASTKSLIDSSVPTQGISAENINSLDKEIFKSDVTDIVDVQATNIYNNQTEKMMGDKFIWDTNQQRKVFDRIYNSFKKSLNENAEKELFNRFLSQISHLSHDDSKLLCLSIDNINDDTTYWKQTTLESKFWSLCEDLLI